MNGSNVYDNVCQYYKIKTIKIDDKSIFFSKKSANMQFIDSHLLYYWPIK